MVGANQYWPARGVRSLAISALLALVPAWYGSVRASAVTPESAPDAAPFEPLSGYFQLVALHSGKCLDVSAASQSDLAPVVQSDCHMVDDEQWRLDQLASGYYQLTAKHSGKVLDVPGASSADGTAVVQAAATEAKNSSGCSSRWAATTTASSRATAEKRWTSRALRSRAGRP